VVTFVPLHEIDKVQGDSTRWMYLVVRRGN